MTIPPISPPSEPSIPDHSSPLPASLEVKTNQENLSNEESLFRSTIADSVSSIPNPSAHPRLTHSSPSEENKDRLEVLWSEVQKRFNAQVAQVQEKLQNKGKKE